jgi:hypothetical protein
MQRLPRANLSSNALGLTVPHGLLVLADGGDRPFRRFQAGDHFGSYRRHSGNAADIGTDADDSDCRQGLEPAAAAANRRCAAAGTIEAVAGPLV